MRPRRRPRTIAELLRVPYRALVRELYARLAREGYPELQAAHASIFPHIRDAPVRSADIAARAQVTKQAVNYLVDSLERAGYVERIPDATDRRARLVRLTRRGVAAEAAATRIIKEIESAWARQVGGMEVRSLRRALERLNSALEAPTGD